MAGFRTHITISSLAGVGYGVGANLLFDMPIPTCLLAGGLCSVSGMLPDIDSDSGVPLRESLAFAAAVVP
ncbi:MAG: metal-dependent hydrolase, partial [Pirellulales bacterium]|nr:metal-dependent hydrolase [Pirellulales bacterium]